VGRDDLREELLPESDVAGHDLVEHIHDIITVIDRL
jgi:hypothetical protein